MAHADNSSSSSSLFIDTNLDTHFAIIVSHSDTVSDLKRKIMLEHHQCFPAIGDIKIDSLKVKRRERFYHLSDSMLVKSAFATVKDNWFLSVDASRLVQGVCIQQVDNYKVGDQLALTCATDNRSVDQGSPATHLTIVPIVNHVVSSVNQFTTGNFEKDHLKNTEEDRPFVNEINSKKRTLVQTESLVEDGSGSGPSVKKKRKTEEIEASVKASKDLVGENIRTNNENSMENNIQYLNDESTRLSKGEKCSGLDQESTIVSSSIENVGVETHVQKITEASEIIVPDVSMVLEKNIEQELPSEISQKEKGESAFVQNNSEASETVPAILMAVEENIQQEMPSEISQKEKEYELVKERVMGNEIPSSSMRTSDCELDELEKDKTAEKEVLSTSLIKTLHTLLKDAVDMSEKDLGSTVQESADDQIDNLKEDKESSRKQLPEVKHPGRKKRAKKSAVRNKDESEKNKAESARHAADETAENNDESARHAADETAENNDESARRTDETAENKDEALMERTDNIVSDISSIVPATAHETKNDKVSLPNAEKNDVLEKTLPDDVTMQEETLKEIKDVVGRRKKKKDVRRSATSNDAATVTNEENVLLVDAEIPRTEKNVSQGNDGGVDRKPENQNEKMNGRNKRKKKTKKSAKNGEGSMSTEVSDQHLNDHLNENAKEHETSLLDAARKDGDEVKGSEAQVFDVGLVTKAKKNKKSSMTGPEDLPSKCQSTELELEPEKRQSDHQTSKNMTVSEVVKSKDIVNDEGHVSKEGSQEIGGKDTTTSVKVKKPKKRTKEQLLVDSRNDSAIQPQKLISNSENKKVTTNVVTNPNIPKKKSKIDAPRISKSAHANKAHGEPSAEVLNQKSNKPRVTLGLASVKTVQKSAPEVNKSQHVKSLLSGSGTAYGGDSDDSSAEDNASQGGSSSSSGDITSSIDSRKNGYCVVKRKGGGGNSKSKSKNISMTAF